MTDGLNDEALAKSLRTLLKSLFGNECWMPLKTSYELEGVYLNDFLLVIISFGVKLFEMDSLASTMMDR